MKATTKKTVKKMATPTPIRIMTFRVDFIGPNPLGALALQVEQPGYGLHY